MKKPAHRGQSILIVSAIAVIVALVGIAGFAMRGGSGAGSGSGEPDVFSVRRGGFDISIPATGELAAARQIEIRNNLDGRAVISDVVAEGTFVNAGDVVLRLNDEEVRNKLRDAQDKLNVSEASVVTAQATLDIKKKTRQAELDKADLAIRLADLALNAWKDGDVKAKREELALAIQTAEKEFTRLEDRFKESAGLLEKKFISLDEFKRDEIAKMKAESDLKLARLSSQMYEEYHFLQEKAQKESDLDQARSERERVEQQYDAEVRSAQSDVDSKTFQLDSAREKLAELQQQFACCTVAAPQSGLVVYFASTQSGGMGRNEGRPPVVGTELTRNELVIILPDTSQMNAAVKISEALVGQIKPGQHATISCDAQPDRPMNGEVYSVGVMAETGGWRDPNRRDYTVKISLKEGNELGLKPSMRCKANIYVGRIDNALYVPIQAVFRDGPVTFVYVPQGSGFAQKKITIGGSSELYAEIVDGVAERDVILLREPGADEITARIEVPKTAGQSTGGGNPSGETPVDHLQGGAMPGAGMGPGTGSGQGEGAGAAPAAGDNPQRGNRGAGGGMGGGGPSGEGRGGRNGRGTKKPPTDAPAEKPAAPAGT